MSERRIYFIRPVGEVGPIKIGSSRTPIDRLSVFMKWSPVPLEFIIHLPGDMKTEWAIHRCFADAHIHYEWFRATPRLLAAIEKIANGMPVADAIDLTKPLGEIRPRYSRRRLEAAE